MSIPIERLKELHEAVRYANSHGSGQVTLWASELQQMLPPIPQEQLQRTHTEIVGAELREKEAASEAAVEQVIETAEASIAAEPTVAPPVPSPGSNVAKPAPEAGGVPIPQETAAPAQQTPGPVAVPDVGSDPAIQGETQTAAKSAESASSPEPKPAA